MKKVVSFFVAVMLVIIAAFPAFAADEILSPQGTTAEVATTAATTSAVQTDTSSSSPKTGSNDALLYAVILLSVAACGVATVKFVKSK